MAVQLFLWKVLYWEIGDTIFSDFLVLFSFHRICPWFWTNLLVLCLYSKPINCFATNWRWHTLFLLAVLNILCSNLLCGLSRTFFEFFFLWQALVSKMYLLRILRKMPKKHFKMRTVPWWIESHQSHLNAITSILVWVSIAVKRHHDHSNSYKGKHLRGDLQC